MRAWETFVESLQIEMGSETIQKWLKSLKIVRFDACNLYLEAKDAFQAMWFEEHIRQKVLTPRFELVFDSLDPQCTFSSFVVSDANTLTHKVFEQISGLVTQNDRVHLASLTPIYLSGSAGCGKTHLLMATADALRKQGLHVLYTRAQTFTDHVVSAIRAGEMSSFRQAYRNSDVLIVDDVHVFSRKSGTQEEFFHTFNTLHVAGKQMILSANCSPVELQFIEPRLVSRFEWGIALSLEIPTRDNMEKILEERTKILEFPLHQKVMNFLLDTFKNPKSLCQALEALILRLHLNQQAKSMSSIQLTVIVVQQMLADLLQEQHEAALTPQRILQHVGEYFGIRSEDILGRAQTRDCVLPRQISMHLCRQELKLPYLKIGELFTKDHSTVMSSVKQIQKGIDADDEEIVVPLRAIIKKIKA